ncbi:tRNA (guanosine(37)-N1)-methyltransferase TrmD [Dethiosulfatarculus sandiegensis]|uniref:tRNA (guanine-N(1)-)-methyltransferase n=1 Tax=Dethiosulfatarculus sandiegensis TaxID=1429043 RepID=A0A0D2JHC0_9BACT|nr:tRNA (guanosine(37)-N1)-methyltransferase TrmD [Dethiosulfatarculus sandiegensis]KIX15141.1 tRNA (guanine-N1)-methyltransferase [Dethiosulfatarculus sandiegensis]
MIFDILTLLPEVCDLYCRTSIMGRARDKGLIEVRVTNIRDFATDKHRTVDDSPYGGGDGMVMMPGPLMAALESLPAEPKGRRIMLSPQGRPFDQDLAGELTREPRLTLICGRYEGLDQRALDLSGAEEISLGDFVLTGGELGALCLVDAVARLLPGVLGGKDSAQADSFMDGLLEHPHYTRPAVFQGLSVPEILLSGNHAAIERWRRNESLRHTLEKRPDLLPKVQLSQEDKEALARIKAELKNKA